MQAFTYIANPSRVIFGAGSIKKLPEELARLAVSAPILLSGPTQATKLRLLEDILRPSITIAGAFNEATMHTPVNVTEKVMEYIKDKKVDSLVSIGGGSAVGLGKAISIRTGLPHICIPTTYAGSEMTANLGETANGRKVGRTDQKLRPETVIYDTDLTMTLPIRMSCTSGVNAIAHAVEALYAQDSNPLITLFALEGIKALAVSLPELVKDPNSQKSRSLVQYGAWLCGMCPGRALHHKLCHTLGGSFNLPHAETHTIILAHALAYNLPSLPDETVSKLARVLPGSSGDPVKGLNALLDSLPVERSLKTYGMKEADIEKATEIAVSNPYWNPRIIEKDKICELIRRAYAGEAANSDL